MRLAELSEEYLATDFIGRADKTVANHREMLRRFCAFVGTRRLTPAVYSAWIRHCFDTWSENTARNIAVVASARFLAWAERMGRIRKSPHRLVRLPDPRPRETREPFTSQEYDRLKMAATGTEMFWPIVCGWETGMAIGDVCLLRWSSVDLDAMVIRIERQKTRERCVIPMQPGSECQALLLEKFQQKRTDWPNDPEQGIYYVDSDLAGRYLSQKHGGGASLQKQFARIRDKAGVDAKKSFHNLRASYCSMMANGGVPTAAACKATGHRNPAIFERYVTPDVDKLREQIAQARQRQG